MAAIKTIIRIPSVDGLYNIDGDWSPEQIKSTYAQAIPGIQNMSASVTTAQSPEGEVKTITFSPVTGTKG